MNNGYQCGVEELSESNLSMEYTEMSKVVFDSRIATSSEYNPCLNSALEYTVANENISNEELKNIDVDNEEELKRMKRKEEMIAEKRRTHNEKKRSRYQEMSDEEKQAYIRRRERDNAAHKARYHAMTPEERRSRYAKNRKKSTIEDKKMKVSKVESQNEKELCNGKSQEYVDGHLDAHSQLVETGESRTQGNSITGVDMAQHLQEKDSAEELGRRRNIEVSIGFLATMVIQRHKESKIDEASPVTSEEAQQFSEEPSNVSVGTVLRRRIREERKKQAAMEKLERRRKREMEQFLGGSDQELLSIPTTREAPDLSFKLPQELAAEKKRQSILNRNRVLKDLMKGSKNDEETFNGKPQGHFDDHPDKQQDNHLTDDSEKQLHEEVRKEPRMTEKTTSTIIGNLVSAVDKKQHLEELEKKRKSEDPFGIFAEMEMEVMRQIEEAKKKIAGSETSGKAQELSEEPSEALLPTLTIQGASDFSDKLQRYIAAKERQKAAQRAKYKALTPEERTIFNRKMRRGRTEKENAARRAKYQAMTPEERHRSNTKYRQTTEERRIYNEKARMRYASKRKKLTINDGDNKRNVSEVESQNEKEICNEKPREHIDGHPQSVETEDQEKKLEEGGPSKELVDNGQILPTPIKPRQNILENEKYIEAIRAILQAMSRKERRIFIRKRTQEHIDYHQNEISNLKKIEEIRTQDKSFTSNKNDEQHDPSNLLGVFSDIQKEVIQQSVKAKDHQKEERTLLETLNVAEPYSDGGSITSSENRSLKFADLTSNVPPKTGAKSKPNLDKGQLAQRERERKDTANAAQRARYQAMTPEERTIYNKKWRDSRKEKGNAARRAKYQAMTPEERRSRRTTNRQTAEERRIYNEKARMKYLEVKDVRKEQRKNNERAIARYEHHKAALKAKYQAMTPEERRSRYAKNRKKPTIEDEDKKRNVTNVGSQNDKEICNEKPAEHIDHHPDEQLQSEKMIDATTQEKTAANKFRLCGFFPLTISYDN